MTERANVGLSVTVTAEQEAALKDMARTQERPVSWLIRKAIQEYIERNGYSPPQP